MNELRYGPVGDLLSDDPFEWAQARIAEGWHVEGQVLPIYGGDREITGWRASATQPSIAPRTYPTVFAVGVTPSWALYNLVRRVAAA